MRTIQIVNVRWFNATAWYGMELARLLNRAGHETLTLGLGGTLSFEKAQSMGLNPIALPLNTVNPSDTVRLLHELWQIIHDFRPDVINCHRGESFILAGLLKRYGNYALVRTRGDQRLPKNNLPNRILHRHVADAVISTNSVMARHFIDTLKVPSERVYTVLGGVDRSLFRFDESGRKAVRHRYGFTDKHRVIGLLGRFDRVKGQKELIESVSKLIRGGLTDVRLMLIGFPTATSAEEVNAWIREYNMEPYVTVTGKVDDVPGMISALDIGVIASLRSETIARAALEIMSCGRVLISTDVGVMPDLLPAEALCHPADTDALTAILHHGITDAEYCRRLSDDSMRRIATLDSNTFLNNTLAVYDKALSHARNHR